jgi:hypothetical protein
LWTLRVSLNIDIQCKTANEINMWSGLMEGKREREKKITFVEDNYY